MIHEATRPTAGLFYSRQSAIFIFRNAFENYRQQVEFRRFPIYLPSQGLLSARVTYEHGEWRVQAYDLNLANKVYVSGQSAPGTNPDNEFLGNPRQYRLRVYRSF